MLLLQRVLTKYKEENAVKDKTKKEKEEIIKRFDKVKTIAESKELYETIRQELLSENKTVINIDKPIGGNGKKATTINESKSPEASRIIDLMRRVDNVNKKK